MFYFNKVERLSGQIAFYHKVLNHHAPWFLLATIAAWSLGSSHPIQGLISLLLIAYFYRVIMLNDLKEKYGNELIIDGWKIHIKKAIDMLETDIRKNCMTEQQQEVLNLLQEKCSSQIKLKNIFRNRPFLVAYLFFAWAFWDLLESNLRALSKIF
ncbi:hypothetical protein [Neisseria wadsworthii]|uniref:hypothetical protein n=1 Tax=Neisseria wadsworthii TaxID=607711 RepID=UPI000D31D35C|nr:hypothetical protein [Neisseria wadsworthii]